MADPIDSDLLRPSLIDRLFGDASLGYSGLRPYVGLRELRESVGRDLEWLLNSKRYPLELEAFPEARESMLTYGVPDFSVYSWRSTSDSRRIAQTIEETVRRFEPRLLPSSVRVEILPAGEVDDFRLRFRIDAILHVEPLHEPVSFDTEIDFESTSVRVTGSS